METVGLQIVSALYERVGISDPAQLKDFLFTVFSCMHFYRNNTKNKVIPVAITKSILIFFATFIVNHGVDLLVESCDNIQKDILFMIIRSEGEKIKFCSSPLRDRKYVICAFTNLILEKYQFFIEDSLKTVICSLIQLCSQGTSDLKFRVAASMEGDVEDMLIDGASD